VQAGVGDAEGGEQTALLFHEIVAAQAEIGQMGAFVDRMIELVGESQQLGHGEGELVPERDVSACHLPFSSSHSATDLYGAIPTRVGYGRDQIPHLIQTARDMVLSLEERRKRERDRYHRMKVERPEAYAGIRARQAVVIRNWNASVASDPIRRAAEAERKRLSRASKSARKLSLGSVQGVPVAAREEDVQSGGEQQQQRGQ
jgi:hypothetical protein